MNKKRIKLEDIEFTLGETDRGGTFGGLLTKIMVAKAKYDDKNILYLELPCEFESYIPFIQKEEITQKFRDDSLILFNELLEKENE